MGGGVSYRPVDNGALTRSERGIALGMFAGLVMFAIVVALVVSEVNKSRERLERVRIEWEGARIVRICVDGTRIFRMRDGSYRTDFPSALVDNPDTVCVVGAKP